MASLGRNGGSPSEKFWGSSKILFLTWVLVMDVFQFEKKKNFL